MKSQSLSVCLFCLLIAPFAHAEVDKAAISASTNNKRIYPGGRDEEDLKVQERLAEPSVTVDRRTIEQKVLKNYFKKAAEESGTQPKNQ